MATEFFTLVGEVNGYREVALGVDFGDLTETQVEPIFEAFTALPEAQQADMEVDFQDINALATDGGIKALRNEAALYEDENFPEAISAIDGYHAKAMRAFLHKPEYWKGASANHRTGHDAQGSVRHRLQALGPDARMAPSAETEKSRSNGKQGILSTD